MLKICKKNTLANFYKFFQNLQYITVWAENRCKQHLVGGGTQPTHTHDATFLYKCVLMKTGGRHIQLGLDNCCWFLQRLFTQEKLDKDNTVDMMSDKAATSLR